MRDFYKGEVIAIDKPYGVSSFGALAHIRYVLSQHLGVKRIKTGHAGTLDPLATGVLLLLTGKATRLTDQLQRHTKEYTATLQLGATTDSYDREHTVNATYPTAHISRELIEQTLPSFVGEIEQVPPSYSAVKVNGSRAYHLRRKGAEVSLKAKTLKIDSIELTDFRRNEMQMDIRVVCGKGTYIRALARDIGRALGSGAFLTALRRTRVGEYRAEDCVSYYHFDEWLSRQEIAPLPDYAVMAEPRPTNQTTTNK